jgi:hypothetical protein
VLSCANLDRDSCDLPGWLLCQGGIQKGREAKLVHITVKVCYSSRLWVENVLQIWFRLVH